MGYKESYLPASFRGVQFSVRMAATRGGRKFIEHEFPRADHTQGEDNGGKSRRFTLNAYIVGDNYFQKRDKFEDALNKGGVGILVHPYRGTANVKVAGDWEAVESSEEGGIVRYSIPFLEEKIISALRAVPSPRYIAKSKKTAALASAYENFIDIFAMANKPARAVRDAQAAMDRGLSAVDTAKRLANSSADFKREIENCRGKLIALQADLEYIAQTFSRLVDWGADDVDNGRDRFLELRQIADFQNQIIGETSAAVDDPTYPSRQAQEYITQLSVISQVGVFPDVEFTTADDADELTLDLIRAIDSLCASPNVSDELFGLLRDCKAAVHADAESRSMSLPRIRVAQVPETTNTLALLYSEYGDIEDEQAFIDRNYIMHPGFIPAGTDLRFVVR